MNVSARVISEDEAEIRLDRWFRRHFPHITQGAIQKFCRTGQIRVDGKRADAASRLAPGQTIRIPPLPAGPPPDEDRPSFDPGAERELQAMVLYRDAQVIALNKPPGLAVQGGSGIARHLDGMLDALRDGAPDRPRLVHRIDQDTSGVLLLARTPGVAAKLAALFRGRQVQKTYWALVCGRPVPVQGRIDLPLVRFGGQRGERTALAEPGEEGAARALTDFTTLDHAGSKLAWLELYPQTGRTHQLRVHCAAIGAPILGDDKYGKGQTELEGFSNRLHLHARSVLFPHPAGGTLSVAAEPPPHMRESFKTLGFHPSPAPKPQRG